MNAWRNEWWLAFLCSPNMTWFWPWKSQKSSPGMGVWVLKFWCPQCRIGNWHLYFSGYSLSKLMSPPKPQFLHLQNRNNNNKSAHIIIIHRAVKRLNEVMVLAQSQCLKTSGSCYYYCCFLLQLLTSELEGLVVTVQLVSLVQLFGTPWAAAHQALVSLTISQSLL